MKNLSYFEMYEHLKKIKLKNNKYLISIIIPVYNEEKTISKILKDLPKNNDIEIIVIDDHSKDNSVKEIEIVKKEQDITLLRHKKNQGYGRAILMGIKNSKGNIIVTMDSDGQHRPEDIYSLVKPILERNADFTIGSRYLGSYYYNLPLSTRLGEVIIEKLIQIFYGQKIKNNQNGFRAFDRRMLHIFDDIHYQGYAFATELILKAKIYGYIIKECPISVYNREYGSSGIILNVLALNIFSCFVKYFIKKFKLILKTKYPFKNRNLR